MKRLIMMMLLVAMAVSVSAQKKIVGVSGYKEDAAHHVNDTYISAVRNAGGVPFIIPVTTDKSQIDAILNVVDAIVMTGGDDIDPLKWYGEEPVPALGEIVPERDEFDIMLIRAAVAKGVPVLGICRGEQLINVAFGGTLYQDIPSQAKETFVKHRQTPTAGRYPTHSITIEKGSKLEKELGAESVKVNSFHHQSVKDVAPGFKVTARAADGIVEAIERTSPLKDYADGGGLIIGVQFHPEHFASSGDKVFLEIFKEILK
ncbi:MAG: gamma-glutamyl-gamma-aminobutyrate hydrolase family protein [Bacteroidales bacterium]|nr:gamma-glutamyl-gamma-aminobutyrate hydrolase family protein [Bacteroidales bacterium]